MSVTPYFPEPGPKVGSKPRGTVCDRARREFAHAAVDVAEGLRERGMGFVQTGRARLQTVANWTKQLGPAGEEASRHLTTVSDTAKRFEGKLKLSLEQVRHIPKAAREAAMKAHYLGTGAEELTGEVKRAYDLMDKPFNMLLNSAKVIDVKRTMADGSRVPIEGSGKGYPSILNTVGRRILKDAAAGKTTAEVTDAAIDVVARNEPDVRSLIHGFSPEQLKQAKQVAMGHVPDGVADDVRKAGDAMAAKVEWGYTQMAKIHDDALRGVVPYMERTRVELPPDLINLDPVTALPGFFERQALMLSAWRQWGQDMQGFETLRGRIMAENGVGAADRLRDYVTLQLGRPGADTPRQVIRGGKAVSVKTEKGLLQDVRDYTMFRIFGGTVLGPLRNLGGSFTNATDQPLGAWVRSMKDLPPFLHRWMESAKELREQIIESGARTSEGALTEFGERPVGQLVSKAAIVHRMSIEESEFRSAVIGYLGAQENLKRLVEFQGESGPIANAYSILRHMAMDPEAATTRALERSGIDPAKLRKIKESAENATPEQLKAMIDKPSNLLTQDEWATAMRRASHDTQFGYTFANRHVFSGQDGAWGMLYMLKNWGVRQLGFVRDYVYNDLKHGNAKPLVKLIGTTFIVGEMYNGARDALTGSDESVTSKLLSEQTDGKEIAAAIGRDIMAGGAIGILTDVMWGWGNLVFGPVGGTVANFSRMMVHVAHNPNQTGTAVMDFLGNEFVVNAQRKGLWNRIKAASDPKHERFFATRRWRDRAFDFAGEVESPTLGDKVQDAVVRVIVGPRRFDPTERSLTYESASNAITANDVDAAAEHMARLLRTAEDRDERESILRGLTAAGGNRSPLGPVEVRQRNEFLRQFPAAESAEARRLQNEWERAWDRAVRQAERNARLRR